jgi:NAD-dependent deacetylase
MSLLADLSYNNPWIITMVSLIGRPGKKALKGVLMYTKAAQTILKAKKTIAFTGAGISVESGIPPFRGEGGLWNKYDPATFEIDFFYAYPRQSWEAIRDIFYDLFGQVQPNVAHYALAELEARKLLSAIITQNVDHLHYDSGSQVVHEFHGSLKKLVCTDCRGKQSISIIDFNCLPPLCRQCGAILKPDIVFFGESIPSAAADQSMTAVKKTDCMIMIGTTGMVAPANMLPKIAKSNGAVIIEINPVPSEYTRLITDIFLQDQAGIAMERLMEEIDRLR